MAKQKISFASFHASVIAPGVLDGGLTLSKDKQKDIEMCTGIEPGILTIYRKGRTVRVPFSNIASMVDDLQVIQLDAKSKVSA